MQLTGARKLSDILKQNVGLKKLAVREASLDDHLIEVLSEGIRESLCLTYLDLRDNNFEEAGLRMLVEALKVNMSIGHLFLVGHRIDRKEAYLFTSLFN